MRKPDAKAQQVRVILKLEGENKMCSANFWQIKIDIRGLWYQNNKHQNVETSIHFVKTKTSLVKLLGLKSRPASPSQILSLILCQLG